MGRKEVRSSLLGGGVAVARCLGVGEAVRCGCHDAVLNGGQFPGRGVGAACVWQPGNSSVYGKFRR